MVLRRVLYKTPARAWRDGFPVKSTSYPSKGYSLIPSIHMKGKLHNHVLILKILKEKIFSTYSVVDSVHRQKQWVVLCDQPHTYSGTSMLTEEPLPFLWSSF